MNRISLPVDFVFFFLNSSHESNLEVRYSTVLEGVMEALSGSQTGSIPWRIYDQSLRKELSGGL